MSPIDESIQRYNLLGRFILQERQALSLKAIARRGGIDYLKLIRLMKVVPLTTLPPAEMLQGIADGLECPLARVQRIAMEASGHAVVSANLTDEQQSVVDAMAKMTPSQQKAIANMTLQMANEFTKGE